MRKLIILSLALITTFGVTAQNLLKNGDFANKVTTIVNNPAKAKSGEWFIMNNEASGVTEIKYVDGMMQMTNTQKVSWYKAYIGQRVQNIDITPGIYTLSFDFIGGSKDVKVYVYIRQTKDIKDADNKIIQTFFVRNNYNMEKQLTVSGATSSKLADEQAENRTKFSVDYNFGKTINSINNKKGMGDDLQITEIDAGTPILSDFFVAIQVIGPDQTIQIDNVSLVKK